MSEDTQKEKPQDGLALIIGGLFILALIFAAYNYFKSGRESGITDTAGTTAIELNNDQNDDEQTGDLNGDGAQDQKVENNANNGQTQGSSTTSMEAGATSNTEMWTANDYNQGEISGASYTVKSGDTLWEIAEGLYGDGSQWTKILGANQTDVGYLASGQQALIVPGQVLVLP
jgi:nucleoid-associated protein YgaU